ncbi:MAG: NADP-dependent isocitrate dehydrogenase [Steroidobacteraceae bacterium]
MNARIIYTLTDEAPALATYSLLPVVQAFARSAGIAVETRDISLAGRVLASFPDALAPAQQQKDDLAELGELAKTPDANIIKLPNISASVPQLQEAIRELQMQGYRLPAFPENPAGEAEQKIRQRYAKVSGSAVNPVLREGNSDRRVAKAVKQYAKKHPHSMGAWSSASKTRVAHMDSGDFYGNEQSALIARASVLRIEHVDGAGKVTVLKDAIKVKDAELISTTFLSASALREFYAREMDAAKRDGLLISLHLKATMMKVSDPILFGHAVSVYLADVFAKHGSLLKSAGVNPNNGLEALLGKVATLPVPQQAAVKADIAAGMAERAPLAMVDSDKGITNLHVPSDIIIDASMPAAIRASGRMWGPDGKLHDMIAMIPDRCYASIYQVVIDDCRANGAYDVPTMGNVSNIGLMAQAAEEYGSHDKTFEIAAAGTVRVVGADGAAITEHKVEQGDIWRMCQTKDAAVRDWVKLTVGRARITGQPAIFWLDEGRAYDRALIARTREYLKASDASGLDIRIQSPAEATRSTLLRVRAGQDTISVTGNVLRDYLTDLFPILELGTSAKMLSIVPLLEGGGLYETGAGGSAPKHVQQFLEENHLRWDSLGEFLALQVSIEDLAQKTGNEKAKVLAEALDAANALFLDNDKSPSRKVGELDVRGSHFYLTLYWAQALAAQSANAALRALFTPVADALARNESAIVDELAAVQGKPVDIGGYYHPDVRLCAAAMRPSAIFNKVIDAL